jgi:glucose/arabinose dehydrogenase
MKKSFSTIAGGHHHHGPALLVLQRPLCNTEWLLLLLLLALAGELLPPLRTVVSAAPLPPPAMSIRLVEKLTNLGSITDLQYAPGDDSSRLFVVTRTGLIKIVEGATSSRPTVRATPFLDIASRVKEFSERGLLGLAFHPDYATNGYFFVNYIYKNPNLPEQSCDNNLPGNAKNTRISRFFTAAAAGSTSSSSSRSNTVDAATELVVAELAQPFCNHNGGQMQFGGVTTGDAYLYIATGDGGSAGDPLDSAQDLTSYLGKLLRVNVDGMDESMTVSVNNPRWKIPADQPTFCSDTVNANALPEIIAYGLRNPWRFAFDRQTGDLWIADVGQDLVEELNRISGSSPVLLGKCHNFGWDKCEATRLYDPPPLPLPSTCDSCSDDSCFVVPVLQYGRSAGVSITGGYVYRGVEYRDELGGVYFYADYATGTIWGARVSTLGLYSNDIEEQKIMRQTSTFGEDVNGELFVASLSGTLYRIEPVLTPTPQPVPMPVLAPVTSPGPPTAGGNIVKCPTDSLANSRDITADLRLSYQVVVPDNDADVALYGGVFCAELVYAGRAWLALAISDTGTMEGSLAMIGLPSTNSVLKYNLLTGSVGPASTAQTLRDTSLLQSSSSTGTTTTMKLTKILKEAGEIEIDGNGGPTTFLWAHGTSNTLAYHGFNNRGSFTLNLAPTTPAEPEKCPAWLRWLSFILRILTLGLVQLC